MTGRQYHLLDSLRRTLAFVAGLSPEQMPPNVAAPVATLTDALGRLDALLVGQTAGDLAVHGGALQVRALRTALRVDHMRPIARVARTLMRDVPGAGELLRVPSRELHSNGLLAAAAAMENAARPHLALLVQHGLPDDVLTQLLASADALRTAIADRGRTTGERTGATAGVRQQLKRGRDAVQFLDVAMQRAFRGDPEMLARWQSAKRVQERAARAAVISPAVTPLPAPEEPRAA